MIILISGPSGSGKTTLCNLLLEEMDGVIYSISATTRKKREDETDGVDYYFLTEEEFNKWRKKGKFIETAKVHNYYYGTPKENIEKAESQGLDIVMDIDVQGAEKIRKKKEDTVAVFLLPPTLKEAEKRIKNRGLEKDGEIRTRLKNASVEMKHKEYFDYLVLNDELKETLNVLKSIIIAERHSIKRKGGNVWK